VGPESVPNDSSSAIPGISETANKAIEQKIEKLQDALSLAKEKRRAKKQHVQSAREMVIANKISELRQKLQQMARKTELDEGYWEDTMRKMEQDREACKGQSFEKNPLSHDEHGVYVGDKDLAGRHVPRHVPELDEGELLGILKDRFGQFAWYSKNNIDTIFKGDSPVFSGTSENAARLFAKIKTKFPQIQRPNLDEDTSSVQHGDIVEFNRGPYYRPGYFRVDTEDAVGASQERPWIGSVADDNGWYVEANYLNVVLPATEFNTEMIRSDDDVEEMLGDDEIDEEFDPLDTAKQVAGPGDTGDELDEAKPYNGQIGSLRHFRQYMHKYNYPTGAQAKALANYGNEFNLRPDTRADLQQSLSELDEMAIDTNPEDPNSPTIHSHKGANAMSLKGRIMQARAQLKELGQMADANNLAVWQRISKLALGGGTSMGLVQNLEQIEHGIAELSAKRSKGGIASRGIESGIDEEYKYSGDFPHDVDHMPGAVYRSYPDNIKRYYDYNTWISAVNKINKQMFDDNAEYISDSSSEQIEINGKAFAKWHKSSKDGNINITIAERNKSVNETIAKVKGGYEVKSHTGKNLGGPYPSKKQAAKRLGQVEYFKHAKEDVNEGNEPSWCVIISTANSGQNCGGAFDTRQEADEYEDKLRAKGIKGTSVKYTTSWHGTRAAESVEENAEPNFAVGSLVLVRNHQGVGKIAQIGHRGAVRVILPNNLRVEVPMSDLRPAKQSAAFKPAEQFSESVEERNERRLIEYRLAEMKRAGYFD
jgi:hypothetical protein